jgi:hypothetical protein
VDDVSAALGTRADGVLLVDARWNACWSVTGVRSTASSRRSMSGVERHIVDAYRDLLYAR